jgi:cytochrome oxidase Cu insertion factor (SCO1/SenC/PrrC family)/thiol-disulfide isomerase/thioredoxin
MEPSPRRQRRRYRGGRVVRRMPLLLLALLAGVVAADAAVTLHRAHSSGAPAVAAAPVTPVAGTPLDRPVPPLALIDEHGRRTSLAHFRGSYLVLAPSMTLCHETCPLTTEGLEQIRRAVAARGLARRVVVAEATVDPWRDTPARLRAFKRRTGTNLTMLTGTQAEIRRLWRFFGVEYRRVPQGRPPDIDWWTHRPERFDVTHSDGLFLIDPRGRWREYVGGMADVGGRLPARLRGLLDEEGRRNLRDPTAPWRAPDVLTDLWRMLGVPAAHAAAPRAVPVRGGPLLGGGAGALRALRGRPVVVNAWASWCDPCRAEFPILASVAAGYHGRVAFRGLDVSDDAGAARRFLAGHPLGYPSYRDDGGAIARSLAPLQGLPTTFFLDARGRVTYVHTGPYTSAAALRRDVERQAA